MSLEELRKKHAELSSKTEQDLQGMKIIAEESRRVSDISII